MMPKVIGRTRRKDSRLPCGCRRAARRNGHHPDCCYYSPDRALDRSGKIAALNRLNRRIEGKQP